MDTLSFPGNNLSHSASDLNYPYRTFKASSSSSSIYFFYYCYCFYISYSLVKIAFYRFLTVGTGTYD